MPKASKEFYMVITHEGVKYSGYDGQEFDRIGRKLIKSKEKSKTTSHPVS